MISKLFSKSLAWLLAAIGIALALSAVVEFIATSQRTYELHGQEALESGPASVGRGDPRTVEFRPDIYELQAGPYEYYLPWPDVVGPESCLGGVIRFGWNEIQVALGTEPNSLSLEHSFQAIGTDGAKLVLSEGGQALTWTTDVSQRLDLKDPICLNLRGSTLAAGQTRVLTVNVHSTETSAGSLLLGGWVLIVAGLMLAVLQGDRRGTHKQPIPVVDGHSDDSMSDEVDAAEGLKWLRRGANVGFALAAVGFFWLLTAGTWRLSLGDVRNGRTDYLTTQAIQLLRGQLAVPDAALDFGECFVKDGSCYGYFGLSPSLLRIPLLILSPDFWLEADTSLAGFATTLDFSLVFFVASLTLVAYAIRTVFLQLLDLFNVHLSTFRPVTAFSLGSAFVILLALGSPILFLASRPYVYEEAIAWSVAWSLLGINAFLRYTIQENRSSAYSFALFALLAINARFTVGLSLVVLACLYLAARWLHHKLNRYDFVLALVTLGGVALHAFINWIKLGVLFGLPSSYQEGIRLVPWRLAKYQEHGTLWFGFIPDGILAYLRPDGLRLSHEFPFVDFSVIKSNGTSLDTETFTYLHQGLVRGQWNAAFQRSFPVAENTELEAAASLVPTQLLTIALATLGVCLVFGIAKNKMIARKQRSPLVLVLVSLSLPAGLVFAFLGKTYRYTADVVPILTVASAIGLIYLITHINSRRLEFAWATLLLLSAALQTLIQLFLVIRFWQTWPDNPVDIRGLGEQLRTLLSSKETVNAD